VALVRDLVSVLVQAGAEDFGKPIVRAEPPGMKKGEP
jgi:hypothetical protein